MKNIYGITFEELENYFIEKNDKKALKVYTEMSLILRLSTTL